MKEGGSDSARYCVCGDSVALPCVEFLMERIQAIADTERSNYG